MIPDIGIDEATFKRLPDRLAEQLQDAANRKPTPKLKEYQAIADTFYRQGLDYFYKSTTEKTIFQEDLKKFPEHPGSLLDIFNTKFTSAEVCEAAKNLLWRTEQFSGVELTNTYLFNKYGTGVSTVNICPNFCTAFSDSQRECPTCHSPRQDQFAIDYFSPRTHARSLILHAETYFSGSRSSFFLSERHTKAGEVSNFYSSEHFSELKKKRIANEGYSTLYQTYFSKTYEFPYFLYVDTMEVSRDDLYTVVYAVNLALSAEVRYDKSNVTIVTCYPRKRFSRYSQDVSSFWKPILADFAQTSSEGFWVDRPSKSSVKSRIHLVGISGDLTLSEILCFTNHASKYPCFHCLLPNYITSKGRGLPSFLHDREELMVPRDDDYLKEIRLEYESLETSIDKADPQYESKLETAQKDFLYDHGMTGWSQLFQLGSISLKGSFPIDVSNIFDKYILSDLMKKIVLPPSDTPHLSLDEEGLEMFYEFMETAVTHELADISRSILQGTRQGRYYKFGLEQLSFMREGLMHTLPESTVEPKYKNIITELLIFIHILSTTKSSVSPETLGFWEVSAKRILSAYESVLVGLDDSKLAYITLPYHMLLHVTTATRQLGLPAEYSSANISLKKEELLTLFAYEISTFERESQSSRAEYDKEFALPVEERDSDDSDDESDDSSDYFTPPLERITYEISTLDTDKIPEDLLMHRSDPKTWIREIALPYTSGFLGQVFSKRLGLVNALRILGIHDLGFTKRRLLRWKSLKGDVPGKEDGSDDDDWNSNLDSDFYDIENPNGPCITLIQKFMRKLSPKMRESVTFRSYKGMQLPLYWTNTTRSVLAVQPRSTDKRPIFVDTKAVVEFSGLLKARQSLYLVGHVKKLAPVTKTPAQYLITESGQLQKQNKFEHIISYKELEEDTDSGNVKSKYRLIPINEIIGPVYIYNVSDNDLDIEGFFDPNMTVRTEKVRDELEDDDGDDDFWVVLDPRRRR